jgi:hypothetical protein
MTTMPYKLVEKLTVGKFFYQGKSHTHPVRRTVVILEERADEFVGYELRSGNMVRTLKEAIEGRKVKTYKKSKIARFGDYCRLRNRRDVTDVSASTLRRMELVDLLIQGA